MNTKKLSLYILIASAVAIIVAFISAIYLRARNQAIQPVIKNTPPLSPTSASFLKKGTYESTVAYPARNHSEEISVRVTLEGDIITDLSVTNSKTHPVSVQYQVAFENAIEKEVVGKNIKELHLSRVSGASATTDAFMKALEKIKAQM